MIFSFDYNTENQLKARNASVNSRSAHAPPPPGLTPGH